jgi:hypothetical protein
MTAGSGTSARERLDVPAPVGYRTPEERATLGKRARSSVPRERHAEFEPSPTRPDPIDLLEEQSRGRVRELVPIRYGRMAASPFAFYRGGPLIMASDLSTTPVSSLSCQICGDAHLSNFGMFATPERRIVFDINDFDETAEGPWEWDVKRLAASVEIAGRDLGFSKEVRRKAVTRAARSYRTTMREFAGLSNLAVWYASIVVDDVVPQVAGQQDPTREKLIAGALEKMRAHETVPTLTKFTEQVDGEPRLARQPPLVVPLADLLHGEQSLRTLSGFVDLVSSYRRTLPSDRRHLINQYRVVDVARKVVGVGSVGTRDWIILLLGREGSDALLLQAKEAEPSVVERFTGRRTHFHDGKRVVLGQRLMQAASDIFLGWDHAFELGGDPLRDYYLRQFRDWKGSIEIRGLRPKGLSVYARYAGWTLARAHARSGDRIAIAAYLGKSTAFDKAIAEFADRYADQNQRDYDALLVAIKDGRIRAD